MLRTVQSVIVFLFFLSTASAQPGTRAFISPFYEPTSTTIYYKLGEKTIQVKTFLYGTAKDMVYVNVHDDEITALTGAKKLLEKNGGYLIKIENAKERNIRFKLRGQYYTFDPNRMFSRHGIEQTLMLLGNVSEEAIAEVEKFANRILQLIPPNPSCVIALHNNTNGKYSISSYLPGNIREKDAKALVVHPDQDPDDIFLTTDTTLFNLLARDQYNTILQDNVNAKKDGSLSIYCGERGLAYVNCETEHGRYLQYQQMIMIATGHIQRKTSEVVTWNYRLTQNGLYSPKTNSEIMFGEKRVGQVRSVNADSTWAISGKLEFNKDFPLYSNMDFYLLLPSAQKPRFEVRIDPTRQKQLLDPAKTVIHIKTTR
jgi:hypothetical protein